MTAIISVTRFSEIEATFKSAEDEFTRNLGVTACSMVLSRLVGATDKKAEFDFIQRSIHMILQSGSENESLLGEDSNTEMTVNECTGEQTIGDMYSALTDFVERMSPRELYQFMGELRKAPFHQLSE